MGDFLTDFIIALAITAGGGYLMEQIDAAIGTSQQKSSCATQGGTWGTPNPGVCNKGGQAVNSAYTMWGPVVDLGVPAGAAVLFTRSIGGALGAGVGAVGMLVLGLGL